MEEVLGGGHPEQREHRATAGRLARDRHRARIPAERRDLPLHPLQCCQPVAYPTVARCAVDEPEPVETEAV